MFDAGYQRLTKIPAVSSVLGLSMKQWQDVVRTVIYNIMQHIIRHGGKDFGRNKLAFLTRKFDLEIAT